MRGLGRADEYGFVCGLYVQRVTVGLRVDGHGCDAHPSERADDAAGYGSAIGDENLTEHLRPR